MLKIISILISSVVIVMFKNYRYKNSLTIYALEAALFIISAIVNVLLFTIDSVTSAYSIFTAIYLGCYLDFSQLAYQNERIKAILNPVFSENAPKKRFTLRWYVPTACVLLSALLCAVTLGVFNLSYKRFSKHPDIYYGAQTYNDYEATFKTGESKKIAFDDFSLEIPKESALSKKNELNEENETDYYVKYEISDDNGIIVFPNKSAVEDPGKDLSISSDDWFIKRRGYAPTTSYTFFKMILETDIRNINIFNLSDFALNMPLFLINAVSLPSKDARIIENDNYVGYLHKSVTATKATVYTLDFYSTDNYYQYYRVLLSSPTDSSSYETVCKIINSIEFTK